MLIGIIIWKLRGSCGYGSRNDSLIFVLNNPKMRGKSRQILISLPPLSPCRLHNAVQMKQKDKQMISQLEKKLKAEQEARTFVEKQLMEEKKRKKLEEATAARAVAFAAATRCSALGSLWGGKEEPVFDLLFKKTTALFALRGSFVLKQGRTGRCLPCS